MTGSYAHRSETGEWWIHGRNGSRAVRVAWWRPSHLRQVWAARRHPRTRRNALNESHGTHSERNT